MNHEQLMSMRRFVCGGHTTQNRSAPVEQSAGAFLCAPGPGLENWRPEGWTDRERAGLLHARMCQDKKPSRRWLAIRQQTTCRTRATSVSRQLGRKPLAVRDAGQFPTRSRRTRISAVASRTRLAILILKSSTQSHSGLCCSHYIPVPESYAVLRSRVDERALTDQSFGHIHQNA